MTELVEATAGIIRFTTPSIDHMATHDNTAVITPHDRHRRQKQQS